MCELLDRLREKNDFFKLHPQYLPYIGENFSQYKILQIGESQYIEQDINDTNIRFDLQYFNKNWWTSECADLLEKNPWQYDSSKVIGKFRRNEGLFYSIFANFSIAFCEAQGRANVPQDERRPLYANFAFTDLYMMPSLYKGVNIIKAIKTAERRERLQEIHFLQDLERRSTAIIDDVIEVLDPKAIIFTSSRAGKAYRSNSGKYTDDPRVCFSLHPGSPWWNTHPNGKKKTVEFLKSVLQR